MNAWPQDSAETNHLLERVVAGDSSAVDRLFERHLPSIKRSIQRRLRPQTSKRFDVSDVVQEAHELARRHLPEYATRRPMGFGLWLLKTAHRRVIALEREHLHAQIRSVNRELPLPDSSSLALAETLFSSTNTPLDQAMQKERAKIVRQSLARLADHDRDLLMLRVFDGLSNDEAALILDMKPETTKKRFTRALLKLRHLLNTAGLCEESGA